MSLLTYLGGWFSASELGVRLFHTLFISIGLFFLFRTVPEEEKKYIGLVVLSIPLFNMLSFLVFPDSSLLTFSFITIYVYKLFLENQNFKYASILGVLFCLMLYCKYHAVLFIFFIVLSNIKLLASKYFWYSILLASLLFLPHIYWQFEHDWVTFYFHLIKRSSFFKLSYLPDYIFQQIGIIGFATIFVPFVIKSKNQFEKTLKYIVLGTLFFFTLSTLKGFVHLHWTSIIIGPLIILSSKFYSSIKSKKLVSMLFISMLIIFIFRVYFLTNIFGVNYAGGNIYHDQKLWAEDISKVAGDRPVVFLSGNAGYRYAPIYEFYTNKTSVALFNAKNGKKSQYQLWNYEDSIQHKDIVLISSSNDCIKLTTPINKSFCYKEISSLNSFINIKITSDYKNKLTNQDKLLQVLVKVDNHRDFPISFDKDHSLYMEMFNNEGNRSGFKKMSLEGLSIKANDERDLKLVLSIDNLPIGKYTFTLGIEDPLLGKSINSKKNRLSIISD